MTRNALMLSVLVALTLVACGSYGSSGGITSPPPPPRTVTATTAITFSPASLTVSAGDAVTFAFQSVAHNVFFAPMAGAPPDIDGQNSNVSIQRSFTTPGTYHYSCHIHPSMQGTIVVQ
jgi:plastocyanin